MVIPSTEVEYDEPAPPNRGRRMLYLVGGAVAAAGLAAAVVYGPTSLRILQQKDAALTPPEQTAGLARDTSTEAADTADYLRNVVAAGMNLSSSVGAVYTDPADPSRSVIFAGGTAVLRTPETDLDRVFTLVTNEQSGIGELREVPAGPLGGVMRCGSSTTDEGVLTMCAWADHGSIAVALFPGRTVDESAALLRTMRADIQRRA
jgi:hypothetical protein